MKLEDLKENEYYILIYNNNEYFIQCIKDKNNLCIDFIKPKIVFRNKIRVNMFVPENFRKLSNIDKVKYI